MALKGQKISEEHKRKLHEGRDRFEYTQDVRNRMSEIKKQQFKNSIVPWNKGKKMTKDYRLKVAQTLKGKIS